MFHQLKTQPRQAFNDFQDFGILTHRNERWSVDVHRSQQVVGSEKAPFQLKLQKLLFHYINTMPYSHFSKIAVWCNTLGRVIRMAHDGQQFNGHQPSVGLVNWLVGVSTLALQPIASLLQVFNTRIERN